ncbi:MAG: GxxExxY protein [Leptospiraceae bacterium]|nr:GxxExxY protein [Leptospiraceae bacterium]
MDLIYKDECYRIVGAAMEVHTELGRGFLEAVYQEALKIEFEKSSIPFKEQVKMNIYYKDILLKKEYIMDFLVFDEIILEIKAMSKLSKLEDAQLINYLKATKKKLGILINFGSDKMEWKRLVV